MKTRIITMILGIATLISTSALAQKKEIKTSESIINWTGKKVTGSHTGTLKLSSGFLVFDGENITSGEFTVDMSTLTVTDLEAGKGKEKLEGHLNSDDFFGVDNHKNAKLVVTKASKAEKGYKISGDLTIKGKTNPITFDLSVGNNSASTTLKVDRTKYGIRYGSGSFFENLGDKAINNEFELVVDLKM